MGLAIPGKVLEIQRDAEGVRMTRFADIRWAQRWRWFGEVVVEHPGKVTMKTRVGGTRVLDMLSGEQLTRIC